MFLLLIIPILISGFYICNHNLYYYYRLHRYEGQYLYLKSAQLGFFCFVFSSLISLYLNATLPEIVAGIPIDLIGFLQWLIQSAFNDNRVDTRHLSWIVLLTILTPFIGWLWVKMANIHIWRREKDSEKSKIMLMSSILRDSPLDRLLLNSFIAKAPLMLTLNDRKVYVGVVVSMGEPNESEGMDQEIEIMPVISGYRRKEDFNVVFNTDYFLVSKPLSLVIRQEIINSATEFDFNSHSEFKKQEQNLGPSSLSGQSGDKSPSCDMT